MCLLTPVTMEHAWAKFETTFDIHGDQELIPVPQSIYLVRFPVPHALHGDAGRNPGQGARSKQSDGATADLRLLRSTPYSG